MGRKIEKGMRIIFIFAILIILTSILSFNLVAALNTCDCSGTIPNCRVSLNNCDSFRGFSPVCNEGQQNCKPCWCSCAADFCAILSLSNQTYCGSDNKCDENENVTLSSALNCRCGDYYDKKLTLYFIDENYECEFSTNISCGFMDCVKNFTISREILSSGCENKRVYAYLAILYDSRGNVIYENLPSDLFFNLGQTSTRRGFDCIITTANIKPFCNQDNDPSCGIGENIQMNVTVENASKCKVERMSMVLKEIITNPENPPAPENRCYLSVSNSSPIKTWGGTLNKIYYANWTITQIPSNCFAKQVNVTQVSLYNQSGEIARKVDNFGSFNFTGPPCQIVSAEIKTYCNNRISNKCEDGENITLNITVNDFAKCEAVNINKIKIEARESSEGHCVAFMTNSYPIQKDSVNKRYYANWTVAIPPNCEEQAVTAFSSKLYNATQTISEGPASGSFTFGTVGLITECKITNASIIKYCSGSDGSCKAGDKIGLNITVEDTNKCKNIKKIEIDASGLTEEQVRQPIGTGMVVGEGNGGTICKVSMTNDTLTFIQPRDKSYIGNWTVSVPEECKGKTMRVNEAALYNGTNGNNLIAHKVGNFGLFKFEAMALCGNNKKEENEMCDGTDLNGKTCQSFNFTGGELKCFADCSGFDVSHCTTQSPDNCHNRNDSIRNCHNLTGCFWSKPELLDNGKYFCAACYNNTDGTVNKPTSCSDYKNETTCRLDRCGVALRSSICSQTGNTDCHCEWEVMADQGQCVLKFNQTNPSNSNECCIISFTSGTCEEGCEGKTNYRQVNYVCDPSSSCGTGTVCNSTICRNLGYPAPDHTKSRCIPCGLQFQQLPFFEWWQALVVIGLLIVIYAFMRRKKIWIFKEM